MSRAGLQAAHLVWWAWVVGGEGQPFVVGGPSEGVLFCTLSPVGAEPRPARRSGQGDSPEAGMRSHRQPASCVCVLIS